MPEYKLAAENRSDAGKGAARRLRATGRVPAVLYGHGTKPQHLSVDARQFGQALRTDAGVNVLISLEVGRDNHLALAKEIQRHPVKGHLIHVDFIQVRRGEKVHVQVPVHLVGEAPGVREGGIADQDLYQLNVEAEVTAVPEAVEADVSGLGIGDVLRVGDLKAPEGAVILDDAEASVVSVVAPAVEPEPEEAEEAEEGEVAAEGAEAATAEEAGEGEGGDRPEA
jgi:large subunit ribosomal protein L25